MVGSERKYAKTAYTNIEGILFHFDKQTEMFILTLKIQMAKHNDHSSKKYFTKISHWDLCVFYFISMRILLYFP